MDKPSFIYVIYIATTAERLWEALTTPEINRRFWFGMQQASDWKVGSTWRMENSDGTAENIGEVLEVDRPHKLVVSWWNDTDPELRPAGCTRFTFLLQPVGEQIKLTLLHEIDPAGKAFIASVSEGWPQILSSLKTMLETGEPLPGTSEGSSCKERNARNS
jgi:uncharacterized protein YndB with AHSA1/START domain